MPTNSGSKRRLIAFLAGLGVKSSEARSWWSIDVPDIETMENDPVFKKSSLLLLEDTYFLFGLGDNNLNTGLNIEAGTTTPNIDVFPQQWPNHSASGVQVESPGNSAAAEPTVVESPTWSPSKAYQSANGGCPPEHKLHRLWLYDSYGDARYGDGWGTTTLQIRDKLSSDILFEGTLDAQWGAIRYVTDASMVDGHSKEHDDLGRRLEENSEGNAVYICLNENACYIGEISGGTFTEECSWELTRVELETGDNVGLVAKGVGNGLGKCEFGLADSCAHTCDGKFQSLLSLFLLTSL
jgi:hypothetical protein